MPNTPTTSASVASRLTDNEILNLAEQHARIDSRSLPQFVVDNCRKSAAVLREYVRLRKLANAVKTVAIGKDSDYHKVTEIERLLADAEKGSEK